ncbi:hypothetical protein GCM10029992_20670 [Glycomyces albus]
MSEGEVQPVGMEKDRGLFGVAGTGDTSGFGGLVRAAPTGGEVIATPNRSAATSTRSSPPSAKDSATRSCVPPSSTAAN